MTQPNYEERRILAAGRSGGDACVNAEIYTDCIVAAAEMDDITEQQMGATLLREFPHHEFHLTCYGGNILSAYADRWHGDGV